MCSCEKIEPWSFWENQYIFKYTSVELLLKVTSWLQSKVCMEFYGVNCCDNKQTDCYQSVFFKQICIEHYLLGIYFSYISVYFPVCYYFRVIWGRLLLNDPVYHDSWIEHGNLLDIFCRHLVWGSKRQIVRMNLFLRQAIIRFTVSLVIQFMSKIERFASQQVHFSRFLLLKHEID